MWPHFLPHRPHWKIWLRLQLNWLIYKYIFLAQPWLKNLSVRVSPSDRTTPSTTMAHYQLTTMGPTTANPDYEDFNDMVNASLVTNGTPVGWESPYSLPFIVTIAILMFILAVVTVLGNLMVLLSFYIDKNIRTPSNYFIFSLAVSDLIIGFEGFPFYSVYVLQGEKWPLGWFMCDLW